MTEIEMTPEENAIKEIKAIKKVAVGAFRAPAAFDISLPEYATPYSSGADVRSAEDTMIGAGEIKAVSTGLYVQIPQGYELQVRPRSGLALLYGITLHNAPGTIDADYRGEIKVIMFNASKEIFSIKRGDRIAQLVLAPVVQLAWVEVSDKELLEQSARQEGGFGSTGIK